MKRKLNITTSLLLMAALLLTACTSAPSKTNSNTPSNSSTSIVDYNVYSEEALLQIIKDSVDSLALIVKMETKSFYELIPNIIV